MVMNKKKSRSQVIRQIFIVITFFQGYLIFQFFSNDPWNLLAPKQRNNSDAPKRMDRQISMEVPTMPASLLAEEGGTTRALTTTTEKEEKKKQELKDRLSLVKQRRARRLKSPLPVNQTITATTSTSKIPIKAKPSIENSRPIIPLRNDTTKAIAQYCVQTHGLGGVYMKHFRKASGTALYRVMQKQMCPQDIPTYSSELPFFNPETFDILGSTVFITTMRHPIDRIESLYWFEGRWPRNCSAICEAAKIKDDTNKVAGFDEWIEHVHDQTKWKKLSLTRHNACGMWQSVENYYIRMLVGMDRASKEQFNSTRFQRGFLNQTVTRDHLHRAKEILASFDLVLIQEQSLQQNLQNISFPRKQMMRMFYSIVGAKNISTVLPNVRKGKERSSTSYEPMTDTTRRRLQELNALDVELYEYAVQLSRRTVNKWAATRRKQQPQSQNQQDKIQQYPPTEIQSNNSSIIKGVVANTDRTTKPYISDETIQSQRRRLQVIDSSSLNDSVGLDLDTEEISSTTTSTTVRATSSSTVTYNGFHYDKSMCQKPPRTLSTEMIEIALGGPTCRNYPWFYQKNQCVLHSAGAPTRLKSAGKMPRQ